MIKLGVDLIADIEDNTKQARLCRQQYATLLGCVLEDAPWSFAMKRIVLNQNTDEPVFGDYRSFTLPDDLARIVSVQNDYRARSIYYKREGKNIITNDPSSTSDPVDPSNKVYKIYLKFVSKAMPDTLYSERFKEAVATKIAADLAYPMVQSAQLKGQLLQQYQVYVQDTRTSDSQQQSADSLRAEYFDNARRGSRYEVHLNSDNL